jgi:SAM-dependent methyltransferase
MATPTKRRGPLRWGGLESARARYLGDRHANHRFLLAGRIEWMNEFLSPEQDEGIEVGCGIGFSKDFIRAKRFLLTDILVNSWVDLAPVDALATPFADHSLDFVVANNMVHHLARPLEFLEEMHRILKPAGCLLIQDMNASLCMRAILRVLRHEHYDLTARVFDKAFVCNKPDRPWSANCAIPSLLFDDLDQFHRNVPYFEVAFTGFSEFLVWLNSGGVNVRTFYVPLPVLGLRMLAAIDRQLVRLAPRTFALQRQVVLRSRFLAANGRT